MVDTLIKGQLVRDGNRKDGRVLDTRCSPKRNYQWEALVQWDDGTRSWRLFIELRRSQHRGGQK